MDLKLKKAEFFDILYLGKLNLLQIHIFCNKQNNMKKINRKEIGKHCLIFGVKILVQ